MDRVRETFAAVPREGFLPPRERHRATYDGPIPIGHGQTNSQPRTVAEMLRLLDAQPGDGVLDVGSGSGWTTALLAHLVGATGTVVGVELEADLVAFGRDNLGATGQPWARIEQAVRGVLGWPEDAPYDRILVSAEIGALPHSLVDQLAAPGRMVIPVGGRMMVVDKPEEPGASIRASEHGYFRFVPLR